MARYDRYDTSLRVERGQVTAGQSRNRNDYRAPFGYDREVGSRDVTYWRRPDELRGDLRAGAALSYGFGDDADRIRRGRGGPPLRAQGGRGIDYGRGYDRGYRGARGYDLGNYGRPSRGGPRGGR